jgi:FixJ family two-component response regulator
MSAAAVVHVVDDDASFREALTRVLRAAGFEVRAYSSGAELLAQLGPQDYGCVLVDLLMPQQNGLELQEAVASAGMVMPFVFVSGHPDLHSVVCAMRHGAVNFIGKSAPLDVLIAAVDQALERAASARAAIARQERLHQRFAMLTEREKEVLGLVVHGRMNKQIAAELGIHERTVKLHRTAITTKVGVRSVAELTTLARDAGLIEELTAHSQNPLVHGAAPDGAAEMSALPGVGGLRATRVSPG